VTPWVPPKPSARRRLVQGRRGRRGEVRGRRGPREVQLLWQIPEAGQEAHRGPWRLHLRRVHRLCNDIIAEELAETPEFSFEELPKPREIFDFLNDYVIGQEYPRRSCRRGLQPLQARAGRDGPSVRGGVGEVEHPPARPDRMRQDAAGFRPWLACSTCRSPSPTPLP